MSVISMKELLETGVHFGHKTRRWNPKMDKYIFTNRKGIHIVDLQQTVKMFDDAYNFVRDLSAKGGNILFVGTKKQASRSIKAAAEKCDMFYVNNRWLGGMLTNLKTIKNSIARLREIEKMEEDGTFEVLPKKEVSELNRELDKLRKNLNGIKNMPKLPDALFVVDVEDEDIAIKEANKLGIPIIAIVDTNCDPERVDYPIPGNDDAIRALKLMSDRIADAVIEGREGKAKEAEKNKEENKKEDNK